MSYLQRVIGSGVGLTLLVIVSGCSSFATMKSPRLEFAFDQTRFHPTDLRSIVNQLESNQVSLNDPRFRSVTCKYVSLGDSAKLTVNGKPESSRFVAAIRCAGVEVTNEQDRPASGLEIVILTAAGPLQVDVPQDGGIATIRLSDGKVFDTLNGYFRYTLRSVNPDTGLLTGDFECLAVNQNDLDEQNTLVIHNGRFTLTDPSLTGDTLVRR